MADTEGLIRSSELKFSDDEHGVLDRCRSIINKDKLSEGDKIGVLEDVERIFARHVPAGTSVALNLTTFEFVVARTRASALKAYITRFGTSARGWVFETLRPMTVGTDLCRN